MKKLLVTFIFLLFAAAAAQTEPPMPGGLTLKAGWNLISNPAEESITSATFAKYCNVLYGPKFYDTSTKQFAAAGVEPFVGSWVRVQKDCRVPTGDTEITAMQTLQLAKGWNIISGIGDFSKMTGCNVTRGPLAYDTATKKFVTETVLSPEKGYYLRVAQANNLDDFRNLTPGQELFFPPLER